MKRIPGNSLEHVEIHRDHTEAAGINFHIIKINLCGVFHLNIHVFYELKGHTVIKYLQKTQY